MISMLILLVFFSLSILIFIIDNYIILISLILIDLIILFLLQVNFHKIMNVLYKNMLFILFIFLCNLLFLNLDIAFLTALRLFLAINFTYTISVLLPISKISEGFYYLFYPLKLFKINIKNISLIISISLAFIPILINEAKDIKNSLINKGFNFNIKNVITKPHIFLITYFNNIFDRIDELEKALIIKGYE